MSESKKTRKSKKKEVVADKPTVNVVTADCGYCPRIIVQNREPKKEFVIINGKPMCPVCRVTKRGKMGEHILKQTDRALIDFEDGKKYKRELENRRIEQVAAESGANYLKDLTQ